MKSKRPSTAGGGAVPLPPDIGRAVDPANRAPSRIDLIRQAIAEGRLDVSGQAIAGRLVARARAHGGSQPLEPLPLGDV
jgi:hypothetical protein